MELRVGQDGFQVDEQGQRLANTLPITVVSRKLNIRELNIREVPQNVRQTIVAQTGRGQVEEIDRRTTDLGTVYHVRLNENNQSRELQIAENGTVLAIPERGKIQFDELPTRVQDALQTRAGNARIEDIDKQSRNGRVIYEIAYKNNGQHTELRMDEAGTLLDANGNPLPGAVGSSPAVTTGTGSAASPGQRAVITTRPAPQKMTFNQLPAAAQAAIRAQAGTAAIEDIDRSVRNGVVVFELAFKRNGEHQEILVAEDGCVLSNSPNP